VAVPALAVCRPYFRGMHRYAVIEAPSVLGLWPSGVEGLPGALLERGLAQRLKARRAGQVVTLPFVAARDEPTGLLNPRAIRMFSGRLADAVQPVLDGGNFHWFWAATARFFSEACWPCAGAGAPGLLFLDGQADFYQPEAEPKGEAASMDLSLATGRGPAVVTDLEGLRPLVRDEDVFVLGYRDRQDAALHGSQPLPASIAAIDLDGLRDDGGATAAARRALAHLTRPDGPQRFWIHLDVDVLDDAIMPCVDYRMPGGLSLQELTTVLRTAIASDQAAGLEITIYNPKLDPQGTAAQGLVDALVTALE
jgi:arginase